MAEEKPSTISGWIKAGITSLLGLIGGGILMYVSPLVNSAIKPAKPVANFAQQPQGLTVTFLNRSTGGTAGWWDFGDGSALEPFVPNQESLAHTYLKPGSYTAKLSLHNFLGDENDRTVAVNLDASAPTMAPAIESFQVIPLRPDQDAPAAFRVVSQIKNADMLIWSLGDDRPLEITSDVNGTQDRWITLKWEGSHIIRLVAVAGKQTVEKSQEIYVGMADKNSPVAELRFAFEGVRMHKIPLSVNLTAAFPPNHSESTFGFRTERAMDAGFQIISAQFAKAVKDASVKDLKLEVSPDKTKVVMSGKLVKPSGIFQRNAPPPNFAAEVNLTLESRSKQQVIKIDPVAMNVQVPGTTILPIPAPAQGWTVTGRAMQMELRAGKEVFWRDSRLPVNALLQINGRPYRVTAIEQGDQVRLEVTGAQTVSKPGLK